MCFPYDFLNIFFSLSYFIVRMQYVVHITYKVCVNRLYIVSKHSGQQEAISKDFGESNYVQIFNCLGVQDP